MGNKRERERERGGGRNWASAANGSHAACCPFPRWARAVTSRSWPSVDWAVGEEKEGQEPLGETGFCALTGCSVSQPPL